MTEPVSKAKRVWVVRAGKGGKHAADFEELGLVAIGFPVIGDVSGLSRAEILAKAKQLVGSKAANYGQLHRFANEIELGDIVAVPDGQSRELLYGEVTGPYVHHADDSLVIAGEKWHHARAVKWLGRRNRDDLPDRMLFSLGSLLTVFSPARQKALADFLLDGKVPEADPEPGQQPGGESGDDETATSAAEQEARNRELIAKKIAALGWSETQDLVAGVLGGLGYESEVAAAGADGGIDILACRDPLFLHPPVIKIQVKAKPTTKTPADEIRQLNGLVDKASERGIFVSTGGFTAPAIAEAAQMGIQLWDLERLSELFIETYDELAEEVQRLVSLRRIWVLDSAPDEAEEPGEGTA